MSERTFLLQQRQHQPVFEGLPAAHWAAGTSQSLPPPAEPYRVPYTDIRPAYDERSAEREVPPDVRGMPCREAVAALLAHGWRNIDIANALNKDEGYVSNVKRELRRAGALVPPPAPTPKPQPKPGPMQGDPKYELRMTASGIRVYQLTQEMTERVEQLLGKGLPIMRIAGMFGMGKASVLKIKQAMANTPVATALAAEAVAPSEAQLLPEITSPPPPAPPPRVEPARPHHVLDWAARMNAWRFEDRYKPPRPKSHKSSRTLVHAQIRDVASRSPDAATSINSKPSQRVGRPQSIAALAEAEIFGGEK